MINPSELPTNDVARNDAHIASIGIPLYWPKPRIATSNTKRETSDAPKVR